MTTKAEQQLYLICTDFGEDIAKISEVNESLLTELRNEVQKMQLTQFFKPRSKLRILTDTHPLSLAITDIIHDNFASAKISALRDLDKLSPTSASTLLVELTNFMQKKGEEKVLWVLNHPPTLPPSMRVEKLGLRKLAIVFPKSMCYFADIHEWKPLHLGS